MFVVAAVFCAVLVRPYLQLDIGDSRQDVSGEAHYAVLVVHIFTAAVALVLGPLQFLRTIRARRHLHRTIGRVYLFAGVLPAAVAAVPVAILSGRAITQVGLIVPAVLWLVTGALAYRAARRHDYGQHRIWMMRNYALTFLAVTSRILVPLMLIVQIPFAAGGAATIGEKAPTMIPIGQALGWIVNLIIVEFLIRRRAGPRPPVAREPAQRESLPEGSLLPGESLPEGSLPRGPRSTGAADR
jgi:uncharacterized membrane protein